MITRRTQLARRMRRNLIKANLVPHHPPYASRCAMANRGRVVVQEWEQDRGAFNVALFLFAFAGVLGAILLIVPESRGQRLKGLGIVTVLLVLAAFILWSCLAMSPWRVRLGLDSNGNMVIEEAADDERRVLASAEYRLQTLRLSPLHVRRHGLPGEWKGFAMYADVDEMRFVMACDKELDRVFAWHSAAPDWIRQMPIERSDAPIKMKYAG